MKIVMIVACATMVAWGAVADTWTDPKGIEWSYTEEGGTATIEGAYPSDGDMTIPAVVNDIPVKSIGANAFLFNTAMTSVTISEGVASINDMSFAMCSSLTNVTLSASVTNIAVQAFTYCTDLTSMTIPSSVTSIGYSAFSGCSGLTDVTMSEGLTSIGSGTFAYCTGLTSITIPSSVTSIGSGAFSGCIGLTAINVNSGSSAYCSQDGIVFDAAKKALLNFPCGRSGEYVIPSGVTSIGDGAFSSCSGLTGITIPESVTSIGASALSYCTGLTSMTIPSSVTSIGSGAFSGCSGLTAITVDSGNIVYCSIDGVLFNAAKNTLLNFPGKRSGEYVIPAGVTSIGFGAFSSCSGLTSVTMPGSVTNIGGSAFSYCSGLTSMTIPVGVKSIDMWAFSECSGLKGIVIPSSVESIGDGAFPCSSWSYYVPMVCVDTGDADRVKGLYAWSENSKFYEEKVFRDWVGNELAPKYKKEGESELQYRQRFEAKFGDNYNVALFKGTGKASVDGAGLCVWDDYVTGNDPTNSDDTFKATITMVGNVPQVAWKPVLDEEAAATRTYRKFGKVKLTDVWAEIPSGHEADYNFFKVTVEMK